MFKMEIINEIDGLYSVKYDGVFYGRYTDNNVSYFIGSLDEDSYAIGKLGADHCVLEMMFQKELPNFERRLKLKKILDV